MVTLTLSAVTNYKKKITRTAEAHKTFNHDDDETIIIVRHSETLLLLAFSMIATNNFT